MVPTMEPKTHECHIRWLTLTTMRVLLYPLYLYAKPAQEHAAWQRCGVG